MHGDTSGMYDMVLTWLMQEMSDDEKLRNVFLSDMNAMKEIGEAEEVYNCQLWRFDKYKL